MADTSDFLRRLPLSPGLRDDLSVAAVTGALTLVDPARLGPVGRFALHTSEAALVGAITWITLKPDPGAQWRTPTRVAITSGAAVATYAFAGIGETLDAGVTRGLHRRGVRRPRIVMAITAVGLTLGASILDRYLAVAAGGDPEEPRVRDLSPRIHEIVAAMLEQTEDFESLRLRAQLAVASERVWGDDTFVEFVEFAVPDDVPLVVPHTFRFPVAAQFTSSRGAPCTVQLFIEDGRLAHVLICIAEDDDLSDAHPLPDIADWPLAAELTFVQETAGRP